MKIKELPKPIQQLAVTRFEEQSTFAGGEILLDKINWTKTPEGFLFWEQINAGDFATFYEKYPEWKKVKIELKAPQVQESFNKLEVNLLASTATRQMIVDEMWANYYAYEESLTNRDHIKYSRIFNALGAPDLVERCLENID